MLKTAICDLFGIEHPVIQGGMAHLGTAELASAVSNAGGLGIIGAGSAEPDWVRQQIQLTRQRTNKPFGVNILVTSPFVEPVVKAILAEKVAVVTTGDGNPGVYISWFKRAGIKVMSVVASVDLARRLEQAGVDAIVAEGAESGGHVGKTTTMVLVPQVVDSVRIPVVAAGGIGDGRGLAAALALGAQGVQVGTRFICSDECIAHLKYKEKILEADDQSTVVTGQVTGRHSVRGLPSRLTQQLMALEQAGISPEELDLFSRGRMYVGEIEGDVDEGWLLSGQIVGLIKEIKPVKVIIDEMVAETEAVIAGLKNSHRGD